MCTFIDEFDDSVSFTDNKEQEYMDETYDEIASKYDKSRSTTVRAIIKILRKMPDDERHILFDVCNHSDYNLAKDILYPYMVSDVEFLIAEINRLSAERDFAVFTNNCSIINFETEILDEAIKQLHRERIDRNE